MNSKLYLGLNLEQVLNSIFKFIVVGGGFLGLVISSFLSYFVGFVGPFAFCGKITNNKHVTNRLHILVFLDFLR